MTRASSPSAITSTIPLLRRQRLDLGATGFQPFHQAPEMLLDPSELPVVIFAMVRKDLFGAAPQPVPRRGSAGRRSRWRRSRWSERTDVRVERGVEDVVPGYKDRKLFVEGWLSGSVGRIGQRRRTWTTREDVARTKLTYGSMRGTTIASKSRAGKGESLL